MNCKIWVHEMILIQQCSKGLKVKQKVSSSLIIGIYGLIFRYRKPFKAGAFCNLYDKSLHKHTTAM